MAIAFFVQLRVMPRVQIVTTGCCDNVLQIFPLNIGTMEGLSEHSQVCHSCRVL